LSQLSLLEVAAALETVEEVEEVAEVDSETVEVVEAAAEAVEALGTAEGEAVLEDLEAIEDGGAAVIADAGVLVVEGAELVEHEAERECEPWASKMLKF
jgi:hypothetical protein